ncbi:Uncharacterized protein DBV15_00130 [Temnothorax longispinosus]|uniref:Uncharacterized protein n=1 Tax=Temnothorax longispinosus TaxID=300112 RepID=A0A4V3SA36_9HYME|nr:Uncharacterized protein DBV15_00130 [Temnothorax longispinosus]
MKREKERRSGRGSRRGREERARGNVHVNVCERTYPSFIRPSSAAPRVAADRDYARMLQGHICRISTRLLDLAKRLRPTRAVSRRMPGLLGRPPPPAISPLQPPAGYLPIPIGFVIALKCSDS